MTAKEFFESKSKKFPEIKNVIEWLEEYGKQQYNQAIDDVNDFLFDPTDDEQYVTKSEINKLKKK